MHERVAVVRGSVGEGLGVLGRWGARGGIVQMDREPGVGASFRSQKGHGGPSVAISGREHESNNGEPSRASLPPPSRLLRNFPANRKARRHASCDHRVSSRVRAR